MGYYDNKISDSLLESIQNVISGNEKLTDELLEDVQQLDEGRPSQKDLEKLENSLKRDLLKLLSALQNTKSFLPESALRKTVIKADKDLRGVITTMKKSSIFESINLDEAID